MTTVTKNDFCGIVNDLLVCLICKKEIYTPKHVQGERAGEK